MKFLDALPAGPERTADRAGSNVICRRAPPGSAPALRGVVLAPPGSGPAPLQALQEFLAIILKKGGGRRFPLLVKALYRSPGGRLGADDSHIDIKTIYLQGTAGNV
jgi:hypothetical protein